MVYLIVENQVTSSIFPNEPSHNPKQQRPAESTPVNKLLVKIEA